MTLHRSSLLVILAFAASACGGGGTGAPAPAPTPPPGGIGTVTGTVAVAPTALAGQQAAVPPGRSGRLLRRPPGLPIYVPDTLLVKFRPAAQVGSIQAMHQQVSGTVIRTIPRLEVQVVRLSSGVSADAALTAYRTSAIVEYAERDVYGYLTALQNDQFFNLQWHYPAISLPLAWDTTRGSPAAIVAVLDTGIRSHPDLDGIAVQGWDFFGNDSDPTDPGCSVDPSLFSHGMHVTGTIAALTNNSIGVAGVNWGGVAGTRIMPIRVLGEVAGTCGVGAFSAVADGIIYAADHGAKVINMSLGGPVGTMTLQNAVNYAFGLGVTLVAAAGNENGPVGFPAAYPNVIAVAATACNNARASYSNMGPELDVAAPGGDFVDCTGDGVAEFVLSPSWSPNTGNVYLYNLGTSMATPHVAGVAALIISRGPTGPAAIQARLESTAIDLGPPGKDTQFGSGLVNAAAAVGGGTSANRLCVFSGVVSGATITRQSDMVRAADSGAYTVTNAQSGIKSVFAWQDFDGSGGVTPGDAYGQTDGVAIWPGGTTSGVGVTVQTRRPGSPVLSIPGGASCP